MALAIPTGTGNHVVVEDGREVSPIYRTAAEAAAFALGYNQGWDDAPETKED